MDLIDRTEGVRPLRMDGWMERAAEIRPTLYVAHGFSERDYRTVLCPGCTKLKPLQRRETITHEGLGILIMLWRLLESEDVPNFLMF